MFKKKSPDPGKERVSAEEMLAAQMELDELRKKYGIEAPEKKRRKDFPHDLLFL